VRTTPTLDDDVAARLQDEARRTGQPFKQAVNECLRRGLLPDRRRSARPPFRVGTRDLLETYELLERIGEAWIFETNHDAVEAFLRTTAATPS
jgi:hypothetical protein